MVAAQLLDQSVQSRGPQANAVRAQEDTSGAGDDELSLRPAHGHVQAVVGGEEARSPIGSRQAQDDVGVLAPLDRVDRQDAVDEAAEPPRASQRFLHPHKLSLIGADDRDVARGGAAL